MSRSFVRAWATVATIMAMVCLAFVQPMPESTTVPQVVSASATTAVVGSDGEQVGTTAPFVDSITTGKTFTPYASFAAPPVLHGGGGLPVPVARPRDDLRSACLEPPTRPG